MADVKKMRFGFSPMLLLVLIVGAGQGWAADLSPKPAARIDKEAEAQYQLGNSFLLGMDGKTKNETEALKCFLHAAERGHSGAQLNAGFLYLHCAGTSSNTLEAAKWLKLAALAGEEPAFPALRNLQQRMTTEEQKGTGLDMVKFKARSLKEVEANDLRLLQGIESLKLHLLLDNEALTAGLSEEKIRTTVETNLIRAGIKVSDSPLSGSLLAALDYMKTPSGIVYTFRLILLGNMEYGGQYAVTHMPLWTKSSFGLASPTAFETTASRAFAQHADAFAVDFRKANPTNAPKASP